MDILLKISFLALVVVNLTACAQLDTGVARQEVKNDVLETSNFYGVVVGVPGTSNAEESWASFNSATLKKLLHEGLEENFSLKSSEIGLRQSELLFALLRRQRHFRYGAGTGGSYSKFENQDIQESYSTSGFATFDPDFWGKFKLRIEVGEINVQTLEISIESARLALAAAIAQVYTDLIFQTEVLRIREQQINQVLEQKRLQKVKFNAGVITRLDLEQLEVDIESRLLAIEGLQADRNVLLERLSLLLGRGPASLQFSDLELSMFQTFPLDSSESAVILRERPDVKVAELSLLRSAIAIEQAKAEYLPDLSLSLTLSNAQSKISELLKVGDTTRFISTNLTETILDDGSRKTQVESSVLGYEIGVVKFQASFA